MTTADYLEQLQQDREDLVDNLETKGITGLTGDETFTELVPEVLNIPSGGDLSEYFETEPSSISNPDSWGTNNFFKKVPDLIIPNTTTSLYRLFYQSENPVLPKIVCGNNVTNFSYLYYYSKATEIDVSGLDLSRASDITSMFWYCSSLTNIKNLQNIGSIPTNNFTSMFDNSNVENINLSNLNSTASTGIIFQNTFYYCRQLKTIDLSNLEGNASNTKNMFRGSTNIERIDIRKLRLSTTTSKANMFGSGAVDGPPNNCLILVKDQTEKDWFSTNFSRFTNVQIASEYEASQQ